MGNLTCAVSRRKDSRDELMARNHDIGWKQVHDGIEIRVWLKGIQQLSSLYG